MTPPAQFRLAKFDRVLCDVPCSGLGVIAKKPDIRYKDLDGIENLLAASKKSCKMGPIHLPKTVVWCILPVQSIIRRTRLRWKNFSPPILIFTLWSRNGACRGGHRPLGTLFCPTNWDGRFFAAILERN